MDIVLFELRVSFLLKTCMERYLDLKLWQMRFPILAARSLLVYGPLLLIDDEICCVEWEFLFA